MKNDKEVKKAKLFSFKNIVLDFVRITAAPGLLWFRPKHIYENEAAKKKIKGAARVIMNHVGMIDPMYLMLAIWYRRHRFVCKADLMKSKLGGFWLRLFRCIPIDRGNRHNGMVEAAVREFGKGETFTIAITPEATRKPVQRWKRGFWEIARRAEVPIVPACIDFAHKKIWLEEAIWPTDDYEADLLRVRRCFRAGMAKHPTQFVELVEN